MSVDFHPASLLFPLMDGIGLQGLTDDIREHGLLEPIVLHEGQVLDGRNRLRACESVGIEPSFVEWDSHGLSATEWVVSVNLHRRHLTTGQRAALALDLLPHLEAEAHENLKTASPGVRGGSPLPETEEAIDSHSKAASLVGVGRSAVATAKAIQKRDPEIVNEMRAGTLNVAQAAREVGLEARGTKGEGRGTLDNGNRDTRGRVSPVFFGKGDKWREATEPLRRYLAGWEKRGYSFGHLKPAEARKRIATVDALIAELEAARADFEQRSHTYRLTA